MSANNGKGRAVSKRDKRIDSVLVFLVMACLAYFARGAYMPYITRNLPEPAANLAIPPAENISYFNVIQKADSYFSWTIRRPRNVSAIALNLSQTTRIDEEFSKTEYEEVCTIYINAYPYDKNAVNELEIYKKENDCESAGAFYATEHNGTTLYKFEEEAINAIFSTIASDREEFLPTYDEALIAACSYVDAGKLKSAIMRKPGAFTIIFDTTAEFYVRSYEATEWLMSVDFATDETVFGEDSKPFYILKGESGQYYLADDDIMYPIDKGSYSLALLYIQSLDPVDGYAVADDSELYSMSTYLYEDGESTTISNLGELAEFSALIRKISLPVYAKAPSNRKPVMSISVRLNNGETKALEHVGLYSYAIARTEEGEYFFSSNRSYYYPCFKISEQEAKAFIDLAKRAAGEQ